MRSNLFLDENKKATDLGYDFGINILSCFTFWLFLF